MFKVKIYCNDGENQQWWEDGYGEYETYAEALIACYEASLQEVQDLMFDGSCDNWFEIEKELEVTDIFANEIVELGTVFPVATMHYDHAPWDRENDCDIKIFTGYDIVEI
jgi:hypothetical protein